MISDTADPEAERDSLQRKPNQERQVEVNEPLFSSDEQIKLCIFRINVKYGDLILKFLSVRNSSDVIQTNFTV